MILHYIKKPPVITIDGPSGVGKSTLSKAIAKKLEWNLLDSGLIYRILASYILLSKVNIMSENSILIFASNLNKLIKIKNKKIILMNKDITKNIYTQEISIIASKIAIYPKVRSILLSKQQSFRQMPGLVAVGRDMGTVVFSDALIKIFLTANLKKRTERRMLQLQKLGFDVNFKKLIFEIKKRDEQDQNRIVSPLIPAKNAFILDSSNININQLIKKSLKYISKKIAFE